jgi:parallel beta-helix repeat protein
VLFQTSAGAELARLSAFGTNNLIFGNNAGAALTTGGVNNITFGTNAGSSLNSGDDNLAIGYNALLLEGGGGSNIAIGTNSLGGQANANGNVAIGNGALASNQDGNYNVAVGSSAGQGTGSTSSDDSVFIGQGAAANIAGGDDNTVIGKTAGYLLSSGSNNILLGYQAGDNLTTGSNNIIIGYDLNSSANNVSNELRIGGILQGSTSTLAAQFNGTLGVTGLATFDANLRISDGSSNYGTIAVQSTAGDYTYTIPTTTANDTFCLVTLANCAGSASTLQASYTADVDGSDAEILLTAADGALRVRDASSTVGNLFVVEANGGSDYFAVTSTGISLGVNTTLAANQSLTITGGASLPGSPTEGQIYYDSTNDRVMIYDGTKWEQLNGNSSATYVVSASNSVNPYGADYRADGTSDEDEINAAITAANSAGGGTVYLMEGTYTIDGEINMLSNINLSGAGNNTVITLANGFNTTIDIFDVISDNNVTLQNFTINGNNANQSGVIIQRGIATGLTSSDLLVQNVRIFNMENEGIYLNESGGGGSHIIKDSVIETNGTFGIYIASPENIVSNNTVRSNTQAGIAVANSINTIESNYLESNGVSTTTGDISVSGSNNTIVGNTIYNSFDAGIITVSGSYATITGNTIIDSQDYGIYLNGDYSTVTGNVIKNSTNEGIYINTVADNTTVSSNSIDSSGSSGISLRSSSNASVIGNTITNSDVSGIFVRSSGSGHKISDNRIANSGIVTTTADGIELDSLATSNGIEITNNNITDTAGTGYAIDIEAAGYNNTYLSGNIFSGTGATTINDAGTNTIYANQATTAGGLNTTFRQANSTTAFAVQNAAGASILNVDTTARSGSGGNLIKIGNSTGTDGDTTIFVVDSATANPTSNLSALNGGLFYNSTTNRLSVIENGTVKVLCNQTDASCGGNSTTLQQSYDADVDGSDAVLALTSADDSLIFRNPSSGGTDSGYVLTVDQLATGAVGGLDIQSAGTGSLLRIRDTTATAVDVLTVSDGGATTFRNQTNSTSAFQIQNAAGSSLFNIDTTDTQVDISAKLEVLEEINNPFGGIGRIGNALSSSEELELWASTNITVTADAAEAPNRNFDAESLVSTASGTHTLVGDVGFGTSSTTGDHTFSIWIRTNSGTQPFQLRIDSTGGTPATGTAKSFTATTQWKRYYVTQNVTGSPTDILPTIIITNNNATLYAWGGQHVTDSVPGVYTSTSWGGVGFNESNLGNGAVIQGNLIVYDTIRFGNGDSNGSAFLNSSEYRNPGGTLTLNGNTGLILTSASGSAVFSGMGTDITTTGNEALTVTAAGTGDVIFSLDDGTNFQLSGTRTNNGASQSLSVTLGNDAGVDTVSALQVNVTSAATGDADVLQAIDVANLASANATVVENAINLGTGWDNLLTYNGSTSLINGTGQWNLAQVTGTLGVANGGTGATTTQGAINAISQLTTEGDILYNNGTNSTRLARGSNGQCLTSNATTILWGSCGGGGLSATLTDNTADAWDIQEGTNNYININTTNTTENITFGNATTNPYYEFLGTGDLYIGGDVFGGEYNNIGIGYDLIQFGNGGGNKFIGTSGSGTGSTKQLEVVTGDSGANGESSGNLLINTGNGTGTGTDSGNIDIDVGTATGATGSISLGSANASSILIGSVGVNTNIAGSLSADETATFSGNILGANSATGTTGTTTGTGTSTTTLTLTTDAFAVNDVVLIDNVGQDYYTRITVDPGTGSYTVSPAVTFETGRTVTKYNIQNIGANATDYTTNGNKFFTGNFLGAVNVGAGTTSLSDGRLSSSGVLTLDATSIQLNSSITSGTAPTLSVEGRGLASFPTNANTISSYTSLALTSSGYARISYYETADQDLRYIQCTTVDCSIYTISTLDSSTSQIGQYSSIALDSSEYSHISYYDAIGQDLEYIQCTDADCSTRNTTTIDSTGNVGLYTSIALDGSNYAHISYFDQSNLDLKYIQCTNASCSTRNTTTIDSIAGTVGQHSSIALDGSGFARISYYDATNFNLKYIQCTNADCSTRNTTTIDSTGVVGSHTSIALDGSDYARISYTDATNQDLKYIQCTNADCSTRNTTTIDSSIGVQGTESTTSIALDGSDYARISYTDNSNQDLKYIQCTNADCSTRNSTTIESTGSVGYFSSLELDNSGNIRVSYVSGDYTDVKFAYCSPAGDCGPVGATYTGISVGNATNFFAQGYFGNLFAKTATLNGFDLAETYRVTDQSIAPGDIVSIVSGTTVEKSSLSGNQNAIGVVSTKPGITLSEWDKTVEDRPVALAGRVPVKVIGLNGAISAGDPITISDIPGVGMKATKASRILGYALDSFTPASPTDQGTVTIFVKTENYVPALQDTAGSTILVDNIQIGGTLTVTGQTTLTDLVVTGTADLTTLTVTGNTTLTNLVVAGTTELANLKVTGLTEVADLKVNGKIITAGNTPTATLGANVTVGQSSSVTVTGNDTAGSVSYTAGAVNLPSFNLSTGAQLTTTFATPFTTAPRIALTAKDATSAAVRYYVETTEIGFTIHFIDQPTAETTYTFDYIVIQ